jgi:hypothetical protein
MAKGVNHSCLNIWRAIARAGGWHSVLGVTRDWSGIYSLDEVGEYLSTLKRGGFLESMEAPHKGTVFAFTCNCHPLPGESIAPITPPADAKVAETSMAETRDPPQAKSSAPYRPPQPNLRAGALDHQSCPSIFMGRRVAFSKGDHA